jgi:hypothetical protein
MDFSAAAAAAATLGDFEGSEASFFAERTRLGGVRMLLLEGPKAASQITCTCLGLSFSPYPSFHK